MLTETTRTDAVPATTAVDALEAPQRSPRRPGAAIFPNEVFSPSAEMEMTSAHEEASPAMS